MVKAFRSVWWARKLVLNTCICTSPLQDVMFGGTETVASAIERAVAELMMKSPDDLKRVQQELEDVVGFNRKVHESDLETYLSQMRNERNPTSPPSNPSPPT